MAYEKKRRNILQRAFGGPETPDEIADHLRREAPEFYPAVDAAMAVWDELRFGYMPSVYAQALAIELRHRGVRFEQDLPVTMYYRGEVIDTGHCADFVVDRQILIVIKSKQVLLPEDDLELVSQVKTAKYKRGLLFNFGPEKLDFKRIMATPSESRAMDGER